MKCSENAEIWTDIIYENDVGEKCKYKTEKVETHTSTQG
jgi:hypothetical protein